MSRSKEEFQEIAEQYWPMMYRYAYWLSGQHQTAEDIVQEALMRAWKNFDSLRELTSVKSWLMTIVKRENARRFERKQLKQSHIELESIEGSQVDYDIRAEAFALRGALKNLPEDYLEPLVLQVIGGFSCKEISEFLEITPEAVTTRLFRARQKLKGKLIERDEGV